MGYGGDPDSYTPFTIADSIYLSGTEGVNWFLLEYLDCKHPVSHYENTIIRVILGSLYYIKKFNIDDENKQILLDAAKYHLAARTLSCQYFLPIICLIIPDEIEIEYKSVMLVQLLNDRMYSKRSKELIKIEINNGNKSFILNAIEKVALKDEDKNIKSLLLYLDLYEDENKINRTVINKIIKLSVEGDEKLLKKLFKSISENSLITYLKFSVLNNTKISDYAAILLFKKYNEKNLHLIARPILEKTHFSTHYSDERKKILDEILFFSPEDSLNLFLSYRPKSSHFKGGLIEFYIYYFIKLLIYSDRILKNDFFYIIANHPDYPILNRYSDIRNIYKQLLTQKPQYLDFLTEAQENIDYKIRYNANSIRLVCFPEDAGEQLENIIYSAADINSDIYDWLTFCMKLNYNKKTLDNLRSKIDNFPELSQIYILFILHHQDIKLTDLEN